MKFRRPGRGRSGALALPSRSDPVLLSLPGGERVPARVLESGPELLRVATLLSAKALGPGELSGLMVEYGSPRGRVQLTGVTAVKDPSEADVIRVEGPLTVDVLQERDFVRVSSARPVLVYMGANHEQIQSFTVDLSGGGLLLAGPDTLEIGERIEFRLTVSQDSPPVTGVGTVVRIDSKGRRGVSFTEITEGDRRRLVRFIFDLQRAERRRGLKERERYGS